MPLFGRHSARDSDTANVTSSKRRGWALFSPSYPQRNNRTNPNTTTRRTFKRRTNDATRDPARRSRRIGRANARTNEAQRLPLVTKVKRTLGIQSRGRQPAARRGGLFGNTPSAGIRERRRAPERKRGWFSFPGSSSGRYRN